MIFVEKTKRRVFRWIIDRCIPKDSYDRDYKRVPTHVLGCDLQGKLWPISIPREIKPNESTKDLFMAKHCAEEVEEVYGLSLPLLHKLKLIAFYVLIGAEVIIIFLIWATTLSPTGG